MREEPYIGRLNTMAAVFLLLQVQAELNEDICGVAFDLGQKLVELYFNDKLQVTSPFHTCKTCTYMSTYVSCVLGVCIRLSGSV